MQRGPGSRAPRIPPGTVKSRAFYAVRALRKALEKQDVLGE
ncbi:hypothetical protein [Streptomyces coeruleorubidus]|nr:hypothetical protein [Streptomyces coeruleorubidus]